MAISTGAISSLPISGKPAVPTVYVNLTGASGSGQAGTISASVTPLFSLMGVYGSGQAGTITVETGIDTVNIPLIGVAGIGQAGTIPMGLSLALIGVAGSGQAGNVTTGTRATNAMSISNLSVIQPQQALDAIEVSLRTSRTKGADWDYPRLESLGLTGQYKRTITFRRVGLARDLIVELSWSAPVKTSLTGIFVRFTNVNT